MSAIKPLTPVDVSAFINDIVKQRLGQDALQTVDLSDKVAVADLVYKVGMDTVIGDIYALVGKTINKVRAYDGKRYASILTDEEGFNNRIRVRKYYSDDAIENGSMNTDINPTNIVDGANPETDGRSQWTMKFSPVLEMFFDGGNTWSYQLPTKSQDEWYSYFRNPEELAEYLNGTMTEALNALNDQKDAMAEAAFLNHVGGVYQMVADGDMGAESLVDLIALFNKKCGTAYSRTEILTEHLDDFLKIAAAKINLDSERLTRRSIKYHWNPAKVVGGKNYYLKQNLPKAEQKGYFYAPLVNEAFTRVLPEVFNAGLLKGSVDNALDGFEMVDSWQAFDAGDDFEGAGIDVEVAIPTAKVKKAVKIDYLFGMIVDKEAIKVVNKFEHVGVTPWHAVSGTQNTFYRFFKNALDDFTDNTIIYVLGDGVAETESFEGDGAETDFVIAGTVNKLIGVTVDGVAVSEEDYTYTAATQTVTFDTAPAAGKAIVISYI